MTVVFTPSTDANFLRDEIVLGLAGVGDATLIQGNGSAGTFENQGGSFIFTQGVLLSTGPGSNSEPPNTSGTTGGLASEQGDTDLNSWFGVTTTDTTSLEFDFTSNGDDLVISYIFASEEYNERADPGDSVDVFAIFVDGVNYAVVPGDAPVAPNGVNVSFVNSGNPAGTADVNADLYNNNDPTSLPPANAVALNEVGYDGFTDPLRAIIPGLPIGTRRIKITVSDVGPEDELDTAVFIRLDSLRPLPRNAGISGTKWDDLNGNGVQDTGEFGLGGWTIYVDLNNDGAFQPTEPSAITDATTGGYQIGNLQPGDYTVREIPQAPWQQTFPIAGGPHSVTLGFDGAPLIATDVDFGNNLSGLFGRKWHDLNDDGKMNGTEPGIGNWTIYVDLDDSGDVSVGDLVTTTDSQGYYEFPSVGAGTYTVREELRTGWTQTHPSSGKYTVTLANDFQRRENLNFGNLQVGGLRGFKWHDLNQNGQVDTGEPRLAGWTIFIDENNDGVLSPGELSAVTDATGDYGFPGIDPGTYSIAEVSQPNWEQTFPAGDGVHVVNVVGGIELKNVNFGNKGFGSVSGVKYFDRNDNGQQDPSERGVSNVYLFVDVDQDGVPGVGEPGAYTDSSGNFTVERIEPGTYELREDVPPGWRQTEPVSGKYDFTVAAGEALSGFEFGNYSLVDWGDAPSVYPTLAADGGASHEITPGFHLGPGAPGVVMVDAESDGQPTLFADGDDVNGFDDEDGVIFTSPLVAGSLATIDIIGGPAQDVVLGKLQGWIDFRGDGDWDDPGEQIFFDEIIASGVNSLTFPVPFTAAGGPTYARFRISYESGLGYDGPAASGEVEDYLVAIDSAVNPFAPGGVNLGVVVDKMRTDVNHPGPEAWYRVRAGVTGLFRVTADFDHGDGDINLAIYDSRGLPLAESSTATDQEQIDFSSVSGATYYVKVIGTNPSVDLRFQNAVAINGSPTFVGTDGGDVFEFIAGDMSHRVIANGDLYLFDVDVVDAFVFEGKGGRDTLDVTGTDGSEVAKFRPYELDLTGPGYSVEATTIEVINVDAGAGDDRAKYDDSAGDDRYHGYPDTSLMRDVNSNYVNSGRGFERVDVFSTQGGNDIASLYDSAADDRFLAYPTVTVLRSTDFSYYHRVKGFDRVHAFATTGDDRASFFDTTGDDRFSATPTVAVLRNTSDDYYNRAKGFNLVTAYATSGNDLAYIHDSSADDTLEIRSNYALLRDATASYSNKARGFDRVRVVATAGGNDTATVQDGSGDDLFYGRDDYFYLSALSYYYYGKGFDGVSADATEGPTNTLDVNAVDYLFQSSGDWL